MTSTETVGLTAPASAYSEPDPSQVDAGSQVAAGARVDAGLRAAVDAAELERSAEEISAAMITVMRQLNSIKSRVATGPNGESSPLFLLFQLAHHGPRRASDLAEQMCADPSTVSRQVASLVKERLLERRADPDDGRASILVPTDKGLATVREHAARRGLTMQPVIAGWPQRDRDEFLRLITTYTEGIEAHREHIIQAMLRHHGKGSS